MESIFIFLIMLKELDLPSSFYIMLPNFYIKKEDTEEWRRAIDFLCRKSKQVSQRKIFDGYKYTEVYNNRMGCAWRVEDLCSKKLKLSPIEALRLLGAETIQHYEIY